MNDADRKERTRRTARMLFHSLPRGVGFDLWKRFDRDLARELSMFFTGTLYSREVISQTQRELCAVASLTVLHRPHELRAHLHAALNVGATRREVAEVIFQQVTYGGMPVVVELVGGLEPARSLILKALGAGKHVVTANKALLAHHGAELFAEARRRGVALGFEAAVAGGIPLIRALKEGLVANRILSVFGIVNGTCNYILTKMTDEGLDFSLVLKEAQAHGYAEADPTFDIEGNDSAHKLQILVALAFRTFVPLKDIHTEGITRVTAGDIAYARELATFSSPASMAAMKRQVYADLERPLAAAADEANRLMLESFERPDFVEGVQSFGEKREPDFAPVTSERAPA